MIFGIKFSFYVLLTFSELSAGHITEDYVQNQHVTDHVVEVYDPQYHVTTEDHMKDYLEGQNVTSDQHIILVG